MSNCITISLEDVRFFAHHGVMEQERQVGNEFRVDLNLVVPVTEGMRCDRLDGTVSYADVYELLAAEMKKPSLTLEHVCLRVAGALHSRCPEIKRGRIRLCKVAPPIPGIDGSAAVTYEF